ncbi:hypothetical protein CAPTEDRAFT_220079 [Capitella teleta]|uniref:Uncharacterized protein n=2 Tax=Capitella teleta TaxID=283909 RepID=R7T3P1_CAPTE|nr:hypothetical protein CAPTEDRAFT_220079 [Capitella teleta]|eukprot:ELT87343.1 hypothetical protein CAPTEDRAFT_220079 [Capitella teleta]
MGLFQQVVASLSPCWVEYFTTIGLIVSVFLGYRICQGFYNIFNQFVLGRIFGPALDLKKLGKWAVVTGATDGIGLAYAKQLAKRGICIVFVSRSQEKLEHCAQEFEEKYGVETKTIMFDFSQPYHKYDTVKKGLAGLEVGILGNIRLTWREYLICALSWSPAGDDYIAISKVTTTQPLGKFNHRRLDLSSKRLEAGRSPCNKAQQLSSFESEQEHGKRRCTPPVYFKDYDTDGSGSLPRELKVDMQVPSAHSAKKGKRFGGGCFLPPPCPCDKLNDLTHIQALSYAMMTHCVLPGMMERRRGAVVSVSSFSAYVPMPFLSIYPATKCLLPHLVRTKMLFDDREPNLLIPSPDTYCKSAIYTLGRSERTFGYFPHFLLGCVADLLGERRAFEYIKDDLMRARYRTLKELGISPQD